MDYKKARELIRDGDLIAVHGTTGFLAPFTRLFTGSKITHVGIAIWMEGGLWLAELNGGGNHLIPMSQIAGEDFDVYAPPQNVPRENIRAQILALQRDKIHYGFVSLGIIGLLDLCGLRTLFIHVRSMLVCSGYCVKIYEAAGWPEHTYLLSPVDLVRELKLKYVVSPDGA